MKKSTFALAAFAALALAACDMPQHTHTVTKHVPTQVKDVKVYKAHAKKADGSDDVAWLYYYMYMLDGPDTIGSKDQATKASRYVYTVSRTPITSTGFKGRDWNVSSTAPINLSKSARQPELEKEVTEQELNDIEANEPEEVQTEVTETVETESYDSSSEGSSDSDGGWGDDGGFDGGFD